MVEISWKSTDEIAQMAHAPCLQPAHNVFPDRLKREGCYYSSRCAPRRVVSYNTGRIAVWTRQQKRKSTAAWLVCAASFFLSQSWQQYNATESALILPGQQVPGCPERSHSPRRSLARVSTRKPCPSARGLSRAAGRVLENSKARERAN